MKHAHPLLNQRMKLWLQRFWIVLLVAALLKLSLVYLPSKAQTLEIPATVRPCIPQQTRQPITRSELIGSTQLQNRTYYLLAAHTHGDEPPTDLIIAVTNSNCEEVFFNPMGDRIAFASVVPQTVAQQLILARYRQEIQRIGKDRFQQQITEAASSSQSPTWFEEEVWALRRLGITVPTNVQIEP